MSRIAAIVINSVSHDARVLKEADSLAAAGYEVAIFGIRDNRASEPKTVRDSGVVIHRCDWRPRGHRLAAGWVLAGGLLALGLATAVHLLWLDDIVDYVHSRAFIEHLSFLAIGLVSLVFSTAFVKQYLRSQSTGEGDEDAARSAAALLALRNPASPLLQRCKTALSQAAMRAEILKLLREFQPDVIHCHDLNALPVGWAYKRRTGKPIVFDSHELYEELSMATPMQKFMHRIKQRRYSGKVDRFITINDSIAEYLRNRYPKLPTAVIVKNAAIAPATATVAAPGKDLPYDGRLHRAAGLDASIRILLYQGGFSPFRGLEALVRGGVLLPEGWCLVMMGWGKIEPDLRAIAASIDHGARKIRFIAAAPQKELARWTSGATLGVIPYENVCLNHWYCTPNKLWEYPVAGVPILVSPFPEMERVVNEHGIGRLLSDPVTPKNIAHTVASLRELDIERMKQNCRAYIAADNWSVYEARLVGLYDQLFGRESRAASEARPLSVVAEPKIVGAVGGTVAGGGGGADLQSIQR